jgi:hypothetical protein
MIDTGHTLTLAARTLHEKGAKTIYVLISHGAYPIEEVNFWSADNTRRTLRGSPDGFFEQSSNRAACGTFCLAFVLLLTSLAGHQYHSTKRAQGTIFEANSIGHQLHYRREHTSHTQR